MTDIAALARRVERLEARVAISELASAYAVACDEHDIERLGTLFAEDAVMDSPSKLLVANGRAEILAMFVRLYNYVAFTAKRYNSAIQVIGGTQLNVLS